MEYFTKVAYLIHFHLFITAVNMQIVGKWLTGSHCYFDQLSINLPFSRARSTQVPLFPYAAALQVYKCVCGSEW